MSCGVGCRLGSDPKLLWLWCRPVAVAPIRPLAWEPPYAMGSGPRKGKKTKKKKKNAGTLHISFNFHYYFLLESLGKITNKEIIVTVKLRENVIIENRTYKVDLER